MYVDLSYDACIGVFAAMGLFNQTKGPLDTTKTVKDRTRITSKMVSYDRPEGILFSSLTIPAATTPSRLMGWQIWVTGDGAEGGRETKEET